MKAITLTEDYLKGTLKLIEESLERGINIKNKFKQKCVGSYVGSAIHISIRPQYGYDITVKLDLNDLANDIIVVSDTDEVVGYLQYEYSKGRARIKHILTQENYKTHVAQALFTECMNRVKDKTYILEVTALASDKAVRAVLHKEKCEAVALTNATMIYGKRM